MWTLAVTEVEQREQPMKPTYFDLTVCDVGQAKAFFQPVRANP